MYVTIKISANKPRPKPKYGDRKLIKGVMHKRDFKRVYHNGKPIGYDCTGGRQNYVWVPVVE